MAAVALTFATPLLAAAASHAEDLAANPLAAASAAGEASSSAAASFAAEMAAVPAGYVPSPYEPGWEVWVGFVAGVVPFLIGSFEFGKRIVIQLRCEECGGRGLVPSAGAGKDKYLRKCPNCGGFFPWISWRMFLSSTAAPGNGGPLQQPRGQTSVLYRVPGQPDPDKQAAALARSQRAVELAQAGAPSTVAGDAEPANGPLGDEAARAGVKEGPPPQA